MPKRVSSYYTSKAPAAVNHLQPLSEGDSETGPQQGRIDLTSFNCELRDCSDDKGPRTGTVSVGLSESMSSLR
jgi:hypothetical protein